MQLNSQVFLKLAETHADDAGDPDYALGDMDIYLARAFALMTDEQRQAFLEDDEVVECMQAGDGLSDDDGADIYARVAAEVGA